MTQQNVYGSFGVVGDEVLAADPVTNLFEGRRYYNSSLSDIRVYDGAAWQGLGVGGVYSPYTKRVGPGETYTTLAAALAAAVVGDWIIVTGNTTDTDLTLSINDMMIEWVPGAESTLGGAGGTNIIHVTAAHVRLVRPKLIFNPTGGYTNGIHIAADFGVLQGAHVFFGAAQTIGSLVRCSNDAALVSLACHRSGSAVITNGVTDTGVNSIQYVQKG